jgi:hypothetical protein
MRLRVVASRSNKPMQPTGPKRPVAAWAKTLGGLID